ncbi:uncharacterized protein LOC124679164 isoform X2 [Lolium rigidum]|uniref:uncharacterized protein LOC124679164 isoform X2 n=1 Tax=Lolium rigidum TaxID=89674 RepID=UPI001F5D0DC2|nr:uncharacterized protein LOC124679164 isoform X2 [Lolium rigidum]
MDFPLDPVSRFAAEVAVLSLHGDDSASSYAGPAAAGASVIGDLADGASVGDVGRVMGGADGPDSAQSTGIDNPQSAGWTKRQQVQLNFTLLDQGGMRALDQITFSQQLQLDFTT